MGLKELRAKRTREVSVSLDTVARETGIKKSTLYYWERHPKAIKADGAEVLARYFGCKPEELL